MTKQKASVRYEGVDFHFLGDKEDSILPGRVLVRDGEMVLDIPGGDGPYLIVGKACGSWFEGSNSVRERQYGTEARWACVGGSHVGMWIEDNNEYLFSFSLSQAKAEAG